MRKLFIVYMVKKLHTEVFVGTKFIFIKPKKKGFSSHGGNGCSEQGNGACQKITQQAYVKNSRVRFICIEFILIDIMNE